MRIFASRFKSSSSDKNTRSKILVKELTSTTPYRITAKQSIDIRICTLTSCSWEIEQSSKPCCHILTNVHMPLNVCRESHGLKRLRFNNGVGERFWNWFTWKSSAVFKQTFCAPVGRPSIKIQLLCRVSLNFELRVQSSIFVSRSGCSLSRISFLTLASRKSRTGIVESKRLPWGTDRHPRNCKSRHRSGELIILSNDVETRVSCEPRLASEDLEIEPKTRTIEDSEPRDTNKGIGQKVALNRVRDWETKDKDTAIVLYHETNL